MAKILTVKSVEAHSKPGEGRREIPDSALPGLYLVVQTSGKASWAFRYRTNGKSRKLTLGTSPALSLAEAREAGRLAARAVAEGRDPGAEKIEARKAPPAQSDLVEDVFDEFVKRHVEAKNRASTTASIVGIIDREIKPAWKGRNIKTIGRRDVLTILDGMIDREVPYMANRTHALLRKAFNWFVERGIVEASPVANLKAPAAEESRDRVLSDDEMQLVWRAANAIGWPFGTLTQLLLLTGQRRDEVAAASWDEFDLEAQNPIWTIPKERAKNSQAHAVPLAPAVVDIIKALPKIQDAAGNVKFLLSTNGRAPISGFSKGKTQLDAKMLELARKAALEAGGEPEKVSLEAWRLHDLRRTAASGMAALGIAPHVVEKVLNHRSGVIKGVALVYNRHAYFDERKSALNAWASRVKAIIDGQASNVLQFHAGRDLK